MRDRQGKVLLVRGAAEGSLQQVDMDLPLGCLLCFVGQSGSGSRAMAAEVLCAESRRRYLMALSAFEREALGSAGRVAVDQVSGLPPAMLVAGGMPRRESLASFLQVEAGLARLWQEHSQLRCPECGGVCRSFTPEEGAAALIANFAGEPVLVLAPVPLSGDIALISLLEELRRAGFVRIRRGGEVVRLDQEDASLDFGDDLPLEVVVDRVVPAPDQRGRLGEALRHARAIARGRSRAVGMESGRQTWLDPWLSCQECGRSYADLGLDDFLLGNKQRHPLVDQATLGGRRLQELESMTLGEVVDFLRRLTGDGVPVEFLAGPVAQAQEMGLGYLLLSRDVGELSTGEQRRLLLVSCLNRGLVGLLYVFDAPTAGLQPEEMACCTLGLRRLVEQGNTVLVLDHAAPLVEAADAVFAFAGGEVEVGWTWTGDSAWRRPPRPQGMKVLRVRSQSWGSLGPLDLEIPLERLVGVSGRSGSGKTTLLHRLVAPALRRRTGRSGAGKAEVLVEGGGWVSRVVEIAAGIERGDQPLLAELGLSAYVAEQYAQGPAARLRGYPPGWFLLDQPGGRCPGCEGRGVLHCDLEFLEDISMPCPTCAGRRYRAEVLEVTLRGVDIAALLETSVERACQLFAHEPRMAPRLEAARRCGLGEKALGESGARLERMEYLRLRLAVELARASARDLVILEHPAAGAHPEDVGQLVQILDGLVDRGASVLVEESNPLLLNAVDWVIAMGPGGGPDGGRVTAAGFPQEVLAGM